MKTLEIKEITMPEEYYLTEEEVKAMEIENEDNEVNYDQSLRFKPNILRNYGFSEEADNATIQIFKGAEGLLGKGKSIRENYHPLTGEGLHAQNFSWSAAHVIMLLMNENND